MLTADSAEAPTHCFASSDRTEMPFAVSVELEKTHSLLAQMSLVWSPSLVLLS